MAGTQVTISHGGMQFTAEIVGGNVQVSVPAASLLSDDGQAKAIDLALIQQIIALILQLLPLFLGRNS